MAAEAMNAWPLSRVRQVATLYSQGLDEAGIAEKLGVSKQAIFSLIGQRKAIFPPPTLPPLEDDGAFLIARAKAHAVELERRRQLAGTPQPMPEFEPGLDSLRSGIGGAGGPARLVDLTDRTCHWPVSGQGAGTVFCGETIALGAVYCGCHRALAYGGAG
jgi:hypothetical protein